MCEDAHFCLLISVETAQCVCVSVCLSVSACEGCGKGCVRMHSFVY